MEDFLKTFSERNLLDGKIGNYFNPMYYGNRQEILESAVHFAKKLQGFHPDEEHMKMSVRYFLQHANEKALESPGFTGASEVLDSGASSSASLEEGLSEIQIDRPAIADVIDTDVHAPAEQIPVPGFENAELQTPAQKEALAWFGDQKVKVADVQDFVEKSAEHEKVLRQTYGDVAVDKLLHEHGLTSALGDHAERVVGGTPDIGDSTEIIGPSSAEHGAAAAGQAPEAVPEFGDTLKAITTDADYRRFIIENISSPAISDVVDMKTGDFLKIFSKENLINGKIDNAIQEYLTKNAGANPRVYKLLSSEYYPSNKEEALEQLVRFAKKLKSFHPGSDEMKMSVRYFLQQNIKE